MQYGQIEGLKRPVSRLVLGCSHPLFRAATRSSAGKEPGFEQALTGVFALLDQALSLGVNTFDCAALYGEEPLGEWLAARGVRDQVNVLSKGAHHNAWRRRLTTYDIESDLMTSLAKMRLEQVDIYLMHRDDPDVPVGPIMDCLHRLHMEGRIGAIGTSNWTVQRIEQANAYARERGQIPFTVNSPHFSLAVQQLDLWGGGGQSLTGEAGRAARAHFSANRMPILAYSSLSLGFFSGKLDPHKPDEMAALMGPHGTRGYVSEDNLERLRRATSLAREKGVPVSQIALSWLFHQPLNLFAAVSTSSAERLQSNIVALDLTLSPAECAWLNLEGDQPG